MNESKIKYLFLIQKPIKRNGGSNCLPQKAICHTEDIFYPYLCKVGLFSMDSLVKKKGFSTLKRHNIWLLAQT